MISGEKGQKVVRACTIKLLTLTSKYRNQKVSKWIDDTSLVMDRKLQII